MPGVQPIYSTVDNVQPQQTGSCPYSEILSEAGTCVCDNGFELDPRGERCRRCEVGLDSQRATSNRSGSGGCTLCAEHYYRPDAYLPATECISCGSIVGVDCLLNATLETLNLHNGHWRHSMATLDIHRCKLSGAWSPCRGGHAALLDGDGYCAAGYRGPRTHGHG